MEEYVKEIKDIIYLIQNNPPDGTLYWLDSQWEKEFDKEIQNWRDLLKDSKMWEDISGIKPRKSFWSLLSLMLQYAPDDVLKNYLNSLDIDESSSAYYVLFDKDGKRLNPALWELLDKDSKLKIISGSINEIERLCRRKFVNKYS
jgi:hypothetical protein